MKKLLLLFSLTFSLSQVMAQTWCPPGATWHFKRGQQFSNAGVDGVMTMTYTGDAIQLGTLCKVLQATYVGNSGWPSSPVVTQNFKTYYTHLTNGVLYILNGNRFDTVVSFNALPGDKWLRPGFDSVGGSGCNSRRPYTVIDTGHVLINGFNLKKVTASYSAFYNYSQNTYTFVAQHTFIERLLFTGATPYSIFPIDCEMDNILAEIPQTYFRCYEDNSFPLYNVSNYGCSSLTGVSSQQNDDATISIYPNPAEDRLVVKIPDAADYTLHLLNIFGKSQPLPGIQIDPTSLQVNLNTIEPGIYFIQVYENDNLVGIEKFVKE